MMKTCGLALALLVLAASWTLVVPNTNSLGEEGFAINGADAIATRATGISLPLPIPLEPRFILEWADTKAEVQVEAVPPELPLAVELRFVLQWADKLVVRRIGPVPEEMPTSLQPRFVFQWADRSRKRHLVYPCELVGEPDDPVISELQVRNIQSTQATVTWLTDEYADSRVEYGLVPGTYPWSASDAGYVRTHSVTIIGLTPDTRYYYQVSSTDRCANSATTEEHWFDTAEDFRLYLPVILR